MIAAKIASAMGVPISHVAKIVRSASHRYKVYRIRKRTGGYREIAHPAKELKSLQRWLAANLFDRLPIHDAVFSYRVGRSIRHHAEAHRRANYLLRIDLRDFFPCITSEDVASLLKRNRAKLSESLSSKDIRDICNVVCRNNRLTIGAPTSPAISNAVLFDFDKHWASHCRVRHITYTRYADDIYLSTDVPMLLEEIYRKIKLDLENRERPKLRINTKKVVFSSRKHNRNVTGLILTSDRKVSIGHKKKRWIKSLVHKFILGELSESDASYLRGFLSFVRSVEPSFLRRLRRKYGAEAIKAIETGSPIQRKNS